MWQRDMAFELKEAKPRERRAIIEKYQVEHPYSYEHMMRIAKQHSFDSGRKVRKDKGNRSMSDEELDAVGAFLRVTRRESKGVISPVENALEFAIDNGLTTRGKVSIGTVQKNLRERQMSKNHQNSATPHTEMRSLHPNHVHEVDVSTCIQFYLDESGLQRMPDDEFYKNKVENFKKVKTPLQRYILTDHFTGFFFVKYYVSAGETAENLFDFLCCAWEVKSDPRMPFRGAPLLMLMDGGCRAKAKAMGLPFWEGIGVDILPGLVGNSRRQGSVEVTHNIWEEWFETRLRVDPANSVEELNRKAFGFCLWYNATKRHSRHGYSRLSLWMRITTEQIRELPERAELVDLLDKPEETRTVTNGRISFQGKEFSLRGFGIPAGAKVTVIKNLYKWREGIVIIAHENNRFEARAIEKLPAELGGFSANAAIIGENFKAQPETATQKANKRMDELAYGTQEPNRKKETPFYGLNAFEGFADKVDNLAVFPKRGTAIELARPVEPVRVPIMRLLERLAEDNLLTPDLNKELRAEFGTTIEAAKVVLVVEAIAKGGDWRDKQAQVL